MASRFVNPCEAKVENKIEWTSSKQPFKQVLKGEGFFKSTMRRFYLTPNSPHYQVFIEELEL